MEMSEKHISISITGAGVYFNNKLLLTDADGNNAAFSCPCPKCKKHPVLLVISPVNTKGLSPKHPAECLHCGSKFVVSAMRVSKICLEEAEVE